VKITTANVSPGVNGASELVKLDSSSKLPAVDGSLLTGVLGTDSTKLPLAGGTMTGDLQVGSLHASTFSASGHVTLPGLASAPAAAAGRLYFDSTTGQLKVSLNGSTFVALSTGSGGGGGGGGITSPWPDPFEFDGGLGLGVAPRADAAATIYTPAIGDATAPGLVFGDFLATDDHARNSTAILGAPGHLADKPFTALGTFSSSDGTDRRVYLCGDGNGHPDCTSFHILVATTSDKTDNLGIERFVLDGSVTDLGVGAGIAYMQSPMVLAYFNVDVSTQLVVRGGGSIDGFGQSADIQVGGCEGCNPSGTHLKFDYNGVLSPSDVSFFIDNQGSGNVPTAIRFRTFAFPSTMVENLTLLSTGYVGVGNTNPTNTLTVGGTPVTWYYCSGSTSGLHDGALMRGNGNAANLCPGGTAVATKISSE
jgi:hypothetical protein